MAKKTYLVPVTYSMYGWLEVKANSLEEAFDFAQSPDAPLPKDGEYLEDSYSVDTTNELVDKMNKTVLTAKDIEFIEEGLGLNP